MFQVFPLQQILILCTVLYCTVLLSEIERVSDLVGVMYSMYVCMYMYFYVLRISSR